MGASRARQILAAVIASYGTSAVADECIPNRVQFDVCTFARDAQAKIAPTLPQKISANVTIINAVAIGPRLVMTIQWNFTAAQLDQLYLSGGKTKVQIESLMESQARNTVCGSDETAAFIRLGGSLQHIYRTTDAVPVKSVLIEKC